MDTYQTEEYRGYNINIYREPFPENPRDWGTNIATFICAPPRYDLGDAHNVEQMIQDLLYRHVHDCSIIHKFNEKFNPRLIKMENGYYYQYKVEDCTWINSTFVSSDDDKFEDDLTALIEEMVDNLSIRDKFELLRNSGSIVVQPISIYDHSDVTISLGGPKEFWDSAIIGFAYIEKSTAEKNNWKEECDGKYNTWQAWAYAHMEQEMKIYQNYIAGDVFGYYIDGGDGFCDDYCGDYSEGCYGIDEIPKMIDDAKKVIDYALNEKDNLHKKYLKTLIDCMDDFIGETWVVNNNSYRIGTDLFGQGCLEHAHINNGHVGCYTPCQVNSLDFETLDVIVKHINKTVV